MSNLKSQALPLNRTPPTIYKLVEEADDEAAAAEPEDRSEAEDPSFQADLPRIGLKFVLRQNPLR